MPLPAKLNFKHRYNPDVNMDLSARGEEGCYCATSKMHVKDEDLKNLGKSKSSRNNKGIKDENS